MKNVLKNLFAILIVVVSLTAYADTVSVGIGDHARGVTGQCDMVSTITRAPNLTCFEIANKVKCCRAGGCMKLANTWHFASGGYKFDCDGNACPAAPTPAPAPTPTPAPKPAPAPTPKAPSQL